MIDKDDAQKLSLDYLDALENRLTIEWADSRHPICTPHRVADSSLHSLRAELDDLLTGSPGHNALDSARDFSEFSIQTVGFGPVSDFDAFVKLGFFYGERVVLWDLIGSRLLPHKVFTNDQKTTIGQAATNLILLRPVVERGGVVILPHPTSWCKLAVYVSEDLQRQGNRSPAKYGLSMALATIEDGLILHPYTLLRDREAISARETFANETGEYYSTESYIFQHALSSVLQDQEFSYLKEVSAGDFYDVLSKHPGIARDLRRQFELLNDGLSEQQFEKELNESLNDLRARIGERNKRIMKYATDVAEATTVLSLSSLITFASLPLEEEMRGASLAVGMMCTRLWIALRKLCDVPDIPVLVQAFRAVEKRRNASVAVSSPAVPVRARKDETSLTGDELLECKEKFFSFFWVEERHEYLRSLPRNVSVDILKSLDADELYLNVNERRYQQDYIGDFLEDVWELSRESFWAHIKKSFEHEDGLLMYDSDFHIERMISDEIPDDVWSELLTALLRAQRAEAEGAYGSYSVDVLVEILVAQATKTARHLLRQKSLCEWCEQLTDDDRALAIAAVERGFDGEVPVWFLGDGAECG
jgi:hypothetical protein